MNLRKVPYASLNKRQKENYNYHKIAAKLAEYGFNTMRLTDDWQGADALAVHFSDQEALKVQVKARLSFDMKYLRKNIWIAFRDKDSEVVYFYNHDKLLKKFPDIERAVMRRGSRYVPELSLEQRRKLEGFKL